MDVRNSYNFKEMSRNLVNAEKESSKNIEDSSNKNSIFIESIKHGTSANKMNDQLCDINSQIQKQLKKVDRIMVDSARKQNSSRITRITENNVNLIKKRDEEINYYHLQKRI